MEITTDEVRQQRASAMVFIGGMSSETYRPNLPEVRYWRMFLSQGGALRAYPELLTAEPRRGSRMSELQLKPTDRTSGRFGLWCLMTFGQ